MDGSTPCSTSTGCYVVPGGWTLVAFAGNQNTACPTNTTRTEVYSGPSASNACSCSCGSTDPTCPTGPISVRWGFGGGNPSCPNAGVPASMNNASTCNTDMYSGAYNLALQYNPPAATGGSCGSASSNAAVSFSASDRECASACTGDCTPSFGAGWQVCVARAGNVACPTTTFTQPYVVGTSATYTCSTNGCQCGWKATCSGTMELFQGTSCGGTPLNVVADGTCNNANGAQFTTYSSYTYVPDAPSNVGCTPSGTSDPSFTLTNEQTICCSP